MSSLLWTPRHIAPKSNNNIKQYYLMMLLKSVMLQLILYKQFKWKQNLRSFSWFAFKYSHKLVTKGSYRKTCKYI